MHWLHRWTRSLLYLSLAGAAGGQDEGRDRPNLLWITIDDCGPDFGCYGNALTSTPRLDALALRGTRFDRCFVSTPVCSPVRSALITGCHATTIGSHQHRSSRALPAGVRPLPDLLREHGYRCTALPFVRSSVEEFLADRSPPEDGFRTLTGRLKLDFNFNRGQEQDLFEEWDPEAEQPFFAMIDFNPQKGPARFVSEVSRRLGHQVDRDRVPLRPYWPDTPEMRDRAARYLEALRVLDEEIGRLLDWLGREGLLDDTVIFVWGDHGKAFFRHKQWCYDSGLRVPLLVAGPGVESGVSDRLVSSIDLAAATLRLAGIPRPSFMEGRDFLAADAPRREYVFASRDRCDETEDRVRAVRDERFKLIRNHHPGRPYIGRNDYTRRAFLEVGQLLDLRAKGQLDEVQILWAGASRPEWEFYDLEEDPLELRNRYDDPLHAETVARLRERLHAWVQHTDAGNPFPEELSTVVPDKALEQVRSNRWAPMHSGEER